MNTKITKILSVLATVAVVASSFVWALPVAASNPGDGTFSLQDIPAAGVAGKNVLMPGSNIVDMAVASDGKTIYVANNLAGNYILKSIDAGQSFDLTQNNYAGGAPVAITVAPDAVNTVAVTDGALVFITSDGGTTWSSLPAPTLAGGAAITDIAVAPARTGTLLGREYVISIAQGGPGVVGGDVKIIGNDATWASAGGTDAPNIITDVFDFTSVAVSPNFLGDRCVVAVGTKASITPATTALLIINTSTKSVVVGFGTPVVGVPLLTTGNTADVGTGVGGAFGITRSSIALPTNFDPTTSSGRRAYVSIASIGANDNDVYRVDDTSSKALGATGAPISSVAYNGTTDTGILFMGPQGNTDVKYTTGMTSTSPTWTTTLKGPTGDAVLPMVLVAVASDYATTSRVFAGTTGTESAFSISSDAGVSFNGEALVNVAGIGNPSLSFTGDAKTVFLTAKDASNYATIWQSEVPFTTTSWKRIFCRAMVNAANGVSLKNNPAWTTTPAMFFFETATANGPIYVSQDGGVTFATRNGPSSGSGYAAASVRDAQTVYYCDNSATGGVYKSTNAGWTWNTVVSGGVGAINSITLPKANEVAIAGTSVAFSKDDAATFTAMSTSLPAGAKYTLTTDSAYATNSIMYTVDTAAVSYNIYRVKTDSYTNAWEQMAATGGAPGSIIGITCRSGILYATTNVIADGIMRTLYPTDLIGEQNWQRIAQGLTVATGAPAAGVTTTSGINLYVRGAVTGFIYAFNDFVAATKPTLTTPEDNYNNAVNPSNGNGYAVDLKWKPMGTGTSQVDKVDIEIVDKSNGFTGLPTVGPVAISPTNPVYTTVQTLQPNKIYQWRVRAAHTTSGQFIDSPWSDARTINVQAGGIVQQAYVGPVLLGPQGGAQNLDPNNVGFAWAPVSGATEYQVIVATDAALTKPVATTPATVTIPAFQATGLAFGTTYFWAVKATKPTESVQTVGTFTTMVKPAPVASTPAGGQPQQTITVNTNPAETPAYIWAVIAIGAILVIAVIILIVRTRRVP